ncbi:MULTISPECIES: SDR family NAD(P)-dependent oxidoreductase [Desulfosediminicola]|uniref:SDR family NAD(P)-dependent oxidoreductase n=1 Tax=Desulfosediminicola TaxID=2886823 RepID=UPI0010ACC2F2|nr:SDR family oxidoreductase [Desulfosediminicola ganghwensis]
MERRVVIYGGSGGIGSATARLLSQQGCVVHLVGRNIARLSSIAEELGAGYTVGDIEQSETFSQVQQDFSAPWDGLVYSIGTINLMSLRRLTREHFIKDFQVNCIGAAMAVQTGLAALKKSEHGASVVLYSSVAARQGFAFHASVGMAKGAINGLTLALAAELAPRVRVNAIAPSIVRTSLSEPLLVNEKMVETISQMHAMKRLGSAEDIAGLTGYLLSADSGWITGQIFGVDGGRSTVRPSG